MFAVIEHLLPATHGSNSLTCTTQVTLTATVGTGAVLISRRRKSLPEDREHGAERSHHSSPREECRQGPHPFGKCREVVEDRSATRGWRWPRGHSRGRERCNPGTAGREDGGQLLGEQVLTRDQRELLI